MIYPAYITTLTDISGTLYYGVDIPKNNPSLKEYLEKLKTIEPEYEKYISTQQLRDKSRYHITLLSVMDVTELQHNMGILGFQRKLDYYSSSLKKPYEIDLLGIGSAEKTNPKNIKFKTYFIVVNSPSLNEFREQLGLDEKDLHITIGFYPKDIFGVPKNEVKWS